MRRSTAIERLESRLFLTATEMVRNGGFEGTVAAADWVRAGNFQADSRFTNFHTGAGYSYLSNTDGSSGNSISGTMYQELTIPAAATSASLSFWTKITTSETTTTAQNDFLTATIKNAAGATLQSLTSLSNLNASSSYVQQTFPLSSNLIGQTVRIYFSGSTNASLATTFRVDDVSLVADVPGTNSQLRVVGYLPYYRQGNFKDVDLSMLTHINYFSIQATDDGVLSTPNVNDANLKVVVDAMHALGKTVSICVGPISLSNLAANATSRSAFAANILNYINARNLDGVDIDWEPPAGNNVTNYGLLIDDLYTKLSPTHKLITAAVNPWTNEIPVAQVNAKMDWLNIMCYDFAPANGSTYSDSVSGMVDWTNYGVTKSKIVMGVPFYGKSGTTWSNDKSRSYGAIINDYKAINGVYPGPDVDSYVDSASDLYYFNGVTTMQKKAAYVRDNGYGGMMTWELGQDRWSSGKYDSMSMLPIMSAMMRPPTWLSPAIGSRFTYVNNDLRLSSGTVSLTADASTTNPNITITELSGSTANFNTSQHLKMLTLGTGSSATVTAGGGKAIVVGTLAMTGGKLDLKDNALIVASGGLTPVRTSIMTGFNGGAWNGAGIITSSSAPAGKTTRLGYAQGNDANIAGLGNSLNGQAFTPNASTALVKFTYQGDADLDGDVDGLDTAIWSSNFTGNLGKPVGTASPAKLWTQADWDYDGDADGIDTALWANNFTGSGGGSLTANAQVSQLSAALAPTVETAKAKSRLRRGSGGSENIIDQIELASQ